MPLRSLMKPVLLVKNPGTPEETKTEILAQLSPERGLFLPETPVHEGDVIEAPDPRGGVRRLTVARVDIFERGPGGQLAYLKAHWGKPKVERQAAIRRLGLEGLHPAVLKAASNLFTDEHYSQAIFEAYKAVEARIRDQSGLHDLTGQALMATAFNETDPKISVAHEAGFSGESEQLGFKLLFMGAMTGIRNPKAHEIVEQTDPQRALEYLAFASLLMRRLDDARAATAPARKRRSRQRR
jgi:uncharacterized protein (TIGR02391 family)